MARELVRSREYKVMLLPERFAGAEDVARQAVDAFWADLERVLDEIDIPTEGSFDEVKAHRRIRFLDTVEGSLNGQRYIFRERVDVESDEREVTLKYRHADRYVAQDRDMDARGKDDDAETKFEEDVQPPLVSVFSYSSVKIESDRRFERIEEVADLFPGLAENPAAIGRGCGVTLDRLDDADDRTVHRRGVGHGPGSGRREARGVHGSDGRVHDGRRHVLRGLAG